MPPRHTTDCDCAVCKHEQATRSMRRGQQIFQLGLQMEIGGALLYLANAVMHAAALSENPRLALRTMACLFDRTTDGWFAAHSNSEPSTSTDRLLASLSLETALGQDRSIDEVAMKLVAARALEHLTSAIVHVAALNSQPRQVLEHVVHRLDKIDVDALRRGQQP